MIAAVFAREGADLVLSGMRGQANGLPDGAVYEPGDVCDDAYGARLAAIALERFGRLDILVNAHGIDFHSDLATTDLSAAGRVLEVNVLGVVNTMKHVLPAMVRAGRGSIVNIASRLGLVAIPGQAIYSASKGGLIMLSRGAAIDYARRGVRINVVAPGMTSTDMIDIWVDAQPNPTAFRKGLEESIPIGRLAEPEEVAAAVVFLASAESSGITGTVLSVDGGYTAA